MIVEIDGNDGVGKTSVVSGLRKKYTEITFKDRGLLTKLTDVFDNDLPNKLEDNVMYIMLDADFDTCIERIVKRGRSRDLYDTDEMVFLYKNRFMRLAVRYGVFYVDTTNLSVDGVVDAVSKIIDSKTGYVLPNPDAYDFKQFSELPLVAQGESKIIRNIDANFNLIYLKPTIYSHKQQRAGIIEGSQFERSKITKDLLNLLDMSGIQHSFVYIGKEFILARNIRNEDIPPVEVVVKKCYVGTDAHIYFGLDKQMTRFGKMVVDGSTKEYNEPYVRFDYRNPNHHPETGKPIGDFTLADSLADKFLDTEQARKLALRAFDVLDKHFKNMGIYFMDVCFMITQDGKTLYGEVSCDCGRFKKIDETGMTSLDKDVWRSGGSSDLVLEKWRQLGVVVHDYVGKLFKQ